jgi:glycolate oxidase iron-sulfur subunit
MFDYTSISDDCIKCGKCKPVCPIFEITGDEANSPRGFIDLLGAYKRDELILDKNSKSIFESCFLCTSCVEVCPNSLQTDMIIEQVRSDIADKFGISWFKRLFFYLLKHRVIMDIAARFGYIVQNCVVKINYQKENAKTRFYLPIVKKDRFLPFAKKVSFLNKYDEKIENNSKQKVAIFIGCMANYSYTNIGDSLVNILKYLNIDILIPKKQLCCSAPAYFTGDFKSVDYLIKKNISYFETFIDDVDAIIVPEATCSAMINIDWEHYLYDQEDWKKRASKIAKKTFIATKWLYDNTDLLSELNGKNKRQEKITYHDPCHSKKMQGVYKEPRELILKNYQINEMSDSNSCCGFGGVTMQTQNYHLAKQIGDIKADMIKNTKANIVSAECSACRMQITNSLENSNIDMTFKNPIELIAQALLK